jgi:hypothetical protein
MEENVAVVVTATVMVERMMVRTTTTAKETGRLRVRRRVPNTTGAWTGNVDVHFYIPDRIARRTGLNQR